jgi:hypothetical protein
MVEYLDGGRIQGSSNNPQAKIDVAVSDQVLRYDFEETSGTTLNDKIGSKDGTLQDGSLVSVDGASDTSNGWRFDDTKVQIDQSLGTVSNISLSIWVKKFDGDRCPIAIDSSTSNFGTGLWFEDAVGSLGLRIGHQSSGTDLNSTTSIPQDGEWHHVVFIAASDEARIYLDGVSVGNNSGTHSSGAYGGALELAYNGSSSAYGNCALDHAIWFNKKLSQSEVTSLYNADEKTTVTNVPDGTRFEDISTRKIYRRATIAGKALGFNGSSSYVYMNDTPDTNFTFGAGCTVSWNMWYKPSSTGQTYRLWAQNRGSGSSADQRGVSFGVNSGTGFNLFAATSGDYYLNGTDANVIPNDTNWHMLTVTYDEDGGSNNLKIYIDGSSVATRTGTTSGSASSPAYYPNIGRFVSGVEYFAGLITEYSVWSRVLTTSEITELYNSGDGKFTSDVSTTGLVAYYKMDESSGDILNYGSGSDWQAANSNITFSETGKVSSQEWKERGVAV